MITKYTLPPEIYIVCINFADQVVETNLSEYASRNQKNKQKIRDDILCGKLAEWGVYFIYLGRGRNSIEPPDMKIYSWEDKSFNPDLTWQLYNIHVKSQTKQSSILYGDSWLFQSKDPLFAYSGEYDIIVACSIDIRTCDIFGSVESVIVEIKLEKPFKNLNFSKPKLDKLIGNKKALYLEDNL
jgi:hypothetical protein